MVITLPREVIGRHNGGASQSQRNLKGRTEQMRSQENWVACVNVYRSPKYLRISRLE